MSLYDTLLIVASAFAICFALSPLATWCSSKLGIVSLPTNDRWHQDPTPLLGGLAIAAATVSAAWWFAPRDWNETVVSAAALGGLVLGLVDDKVSLRPTAKLIGSLAVGAVLVYLLSGAATHALPAPLVVFAVVWFAAVVHAVNLLDNIDGLAAGVCAITACGVAVVLVECGAIGSAGLLAALAGALVGFLPWNTHPARLFMGDGGSLFVGSVLAGASLSAWFVPNTANPFWPIALGVAFIVPLGEAVFVSVLRWMAGRKPTRGGIDHTSHRLVSIGFSERRSVLFLYVIAGAAAGVASWIAWAGATALPGVAVLLAGLGLVAVYLARVPTYQGEDFAALQRAPFGAILRSALVRSHAPQVLLDLVLITACYSAAYRLRFEGESLAIFLPSFTASLPIVLVCKLGAHYASRLYRRSWAAFGVSDVAAVVRAVVVGSTASVLAATYLYRFERFSRGVFIIDAVLLLLAILASRLSFRLIAHAALVQSSHAKRVLICGAGERGQLLAREMLVNTTWGLRPVGIVDGRSSSAHSILGVRVYGSVDELQAVISKLRVEEVVLTGELDPAEQQRVLRVCSEQGISVRELVFEIRRPLAGAPGHSAA